jgi:hypothetical protein
MRHTPRHDPLEAALRDWRSAARPTAQLSDECRGRILREAFRPEEHEPVLASAFLPARRWLAGAALPVVLAGILGYWLRTDTRPVDVASASSSATVEVHRQGNEIVFVGARQVLRSTDPRGADAQPIAGEGRVFRDRIPGSGDLVFYRIE